MTTDMRREVARKQPAEVVRRQRKTIEGRVVRKLGVGQLLLWFLFSLAAFAFAGFLISITQQHV
jgi:hypothetical protein